MVRVNEYPVFFKIVLISRILAPCLPHVFKYLCFDFGFRKYCLNLLLASRYK